MELKIQELSLVLLVGASGSGKTTFAKRLFGETEIVSSDRCRAMISNEENNHDASDDAFELLYFIIRKRLQRGLLTVVDATNVRPEDRKRLIALAKEYYVSATAIVLNMSLRVLLDRTSARDDRPIKRHAVVAQMSTLKKGLSKIKLEGFRKLYEFRSPEELDKITGVNRDLLWSNLKVEKGPFDIIGDIHGCYEELCQLLTALGHSVDAENHQVTVLPARKIVFLGDLVDRGPASPAVLKLVMNAVAAGTAICVPGNHDMKLLKHLSGKNIQLTHGLAATVEQLSAETDKFKEQVKTFLDDLVSHYVLDEGRLVVAHAGLKEQMHGRGSGAVREFCLYGETTGEMDELGMPVRYNWAAEYRGKAMVVYGHTAVYEPQWFNNTIDIDTGCVYGNRLTALRYPEKELVSVPALKEYVPSGRPLLPPDTIRNLQQEQDDMLDIKLFTGKQRIDTRLMQNIGIQEGNAAAALESMSRFAVDPRWMIYLPPTMSPAETSPLPEFLEHPAEAFRHYREAGVKQVICEEKHMGSRAIVIVCKDEKMVESRFGIKDGSIGVVYTRSGRPFFAEKEKEQAFLQKVRAVLNERDLWVGLDTDWVCMDCELMPWNAKAQALLEQQYAATGTAAQYALKAAVDALTMAAANPQAAALLEDYSHRAAMTADFRRAYKQYCWPVTSLDDYKLAPFHILATEGRTHLDKNHQWHMEVITKYCAGAPMMATAYRIVNLDDETNVADAISWWTDMTEKGGEGMVVKPLEFIVKLEKGFVQPAIKVRGSHYLRIIYGPEYTRAENLSRLKKRGLSTKRSLALREFALGAEALERFVSKDPLWKIHQCVFGVLALESEAVDPRL
jgi:protein phosphatase